MEPKEVLPIGTIWSNISTPAFKWVYYVGYHKKKHLLYNCFRFFFKNPNTGSFGSTRSSLAHTQTILYSMQTLHCFLEEWLNIVILSRSWQGLKIKYVCDFKAGFWLLVSARRSPWSFPDKIFQQPFALAFFLERRVTRLKSFNSALCRVLSSRTSCL